VAGTAQPGQVESSGRGLGAGRGAGGSRVYVNRYGGKGGGAGGGTDERGTGRSAYGRSCTVMSGDADIGEIRVTLIAPAGGRNDVRRGVLHGESNIGHSGAFRSSMVVIMALNSPTRPGNACLIHSWKYRLAWPPGNIWRAHSFSCQEIGKDLASSVLGVFRLPLENGYQGSTQHPKHLSLGTIKKGRYKRWDGHPTERILMNNPCPCSVGTAYRVRVPKSQVFSVDFRAVYKGFRKR